MSSKENEDNTLLDYEEGDDVQDTSASTGAESKKGHYAGVHSSGFRDFMLKPELLRSIADNAFEHPSEVQHEVIPQALLGMDVLCQAKSGMGKTAVFVLTTLNQMKFVEGQVSVLVMAHVRELAFQINEEFKRFSKYIPEAKSMVLIGGIPTKSQIEELKNEKPNIIIGTPGRIEQLIKDKVLDVSHVQHFILDECDKMLENLDMRKSVQSIFLKTPHEKQVMMFSATMSKAIRPVCLGYMKDPIELIVGDESKLTLHGLQQYYVRLKPEEKNRKLAKLMDDIEFNQIVIFVSKSKRAEVLADILNKIKFPATYVHGGMKQEERLERYKLFRSCEKKILVSTNLFGRGIDIDKVNVVINYDFPEKTEDSNEPPADQYLHRVGRAGRFGTKGLAISFISSDEDEKLLHEVQERFEVPIPELPEVIDPKSYMNA